MGWTWGTVVDLVVVSSACEGDIQMEELGVVFFVCPLSPLRFLKYLRFLTELGPKIYPNQLVDRLEG